MVRHHRTVWPTALTRVRPYAFSVIPGWQRPNYCSAASVDACPAHEIAGMSGNIQECRLKCRESQVCVTRSTTPDVVFGQPCGDLDATVAGTRSVRGPTASGCGGPGGGGGIGGGV